jgi:hypothetical protein
MMPTLMSLYLFKVSWPIQNNYHKSSSYFLGPGSETHEFPLEEFILSSQSCGAITACIAPVACPATVNMAVIVKIFYIGDVSPTNVLSRIIFIALQLSL